VDCFRYRSRVGLDVAIEALRSTLQEGKSRFDEIYEYGIRERVWNVIRPYAEAIS